MMEELNNLMQNEYEAMTGMETPMSEFVKKALEIVREKLTKEEYIKAEEELVGGYIDAEKFGFEQGFLRGIVVAKGSAAR